jgi:hypothetical protein
MRDEAEARENVQLSWEDSSERDFRRKYAEMRYAILSLVYNRQPMIEGREKEAFKTICYNFLELIILL